MSNGTRKQVVQGTNSCFSKNHENKNLPNRRLSSWVAAVHSTPMDRRLRRASCLEGEPEEDEEVFFPSEINLEPEDD